MKRTTYRNEDRWLVARRGFLGASDAPVLYGEGYQTQAELKASKVAEAVPPTEAEAARFAVGKYLEPAVRNWFVDMTGFRVRRGPSKYTLYSDGILAASLDYEIQDDAGNLLMPLEIKTVDTSVPENRREWDGDEPPLRVQVQVQQQMLVTGTKKAYVAAALGLKGFCHWEVEANEGFQLKHASLAGEWWGRYILRDETPPLNEDPKRIAKALRYLHPKDNGLAVELPREAALAATVLKAAKKHRTELDATIAGCENFLKCLIGDCTYGVLPDGSGFSWKNQHRKGYTVEPSEIRVFRQTKHIEGAMIDAEQTARAQRIAEADERVAYFDGPDNLDAC